MGGPQELPLPPRPRCRQGVLDASPEKAWRAEKKRRVDARAAGTVLESASEVVEPPTVAATPVCSRTGDFKVGDYVKTPSGLTGTSRSGIIQSIDKTLATATIHYVVAKGTRRCQTRLDCLAHDSPTVGEVIVLPGCDLKWTVTASSPLDVHPAEENGACKACSLSCRLCLHFDWDSFFASRRSERPAESPERPSESSERPAEPPAAVAEPAAAPQIVVSMPLSPMVEPFKVGDYVQVPEDKSTLVKVAACNGIIQTLKKKSRVLAMSRAAA